MPRSSPTATNLLRAGFARIGVGPTRDCIAAKRGPAATLFWMERRPDLGFAVVVFTALALAVSLPATSAHSDVECLAAG